MMVISQVLLRSVHSGVAGVFFAGPEGSGLPTVQQCIDALERPGDECRLRAGRYRATATAPFVVDGKHGTVAAPMVITAAEGPGTVVFDGTVPLTGWHRLGNTGQTPIYRTTLEQPIWQLFDASGALQVPARWPNAFWHDKSVFMAPEKWAHSSTGHHDMEGGSGSGLLIDAGACNATTPCCSTCNANDLASSGINATGALAILNLWSCDTGVQRVAAHMPFTNALHYEATWVKQCDQYRGGRGRYYLENQRGLLDAETEFFLDPETLELLWIPPAQAVAAAAAGTLGPLVAYGRTVDWSLNITNSSFLTIANISFFATALSVDATATPSKDVEEPLVFSHHLTFQSLEMNYTSTDHRVINDLSPPIAMTVWPAIPRIGEVATFMRYIDVRWRYSNGNVLYHMGGHPVLENCLAEWNDWSTVGGCIPGQYTGSSTLCLGGGGKLNGAEIRRLTMRKNGRSAGLRPGHPAPGGKPPVLELIHFSEQLEIQADGCFVEGGGNPSPTIQHCWSRDSAKSALRFDGYFTNDSTKMTANGQMLYNVGWNVSSLVVKGDSHNVSRCTLFDGPRLISSNQLAHSLPSYQDASTALNNFSIPSLSIGAGTVEYNPLADAHTVVSHNIFDAVDIQRSKCPSPPCKLPGQYVDNMIGGSTPELHGMNFNIKEELRDPWNWDFRPCNNSRAAALGAGAYSIVSAAGDSVYWIPGAFEPKAATPIPKDEGSMVVRDTDLIFLPAYRAVGHAVLLGPAAKGERGMQLVAQLHGDANVAQLNEPLEIGGQYIWRVDAQMAGGEVVRGDVWSFATSHLMACPAATML
jgi:hypothetical protein